MDLALTSGHDLEIGTDGDLSILTGLDSIAQHLKIGLLFFRGEYFLDLRIGVPYFEQILRKAPDLNVVRSILREAILKTDGVLGVSGLTLGYDGVTRVLSVTFEAATTEGTLTFEDELILTAA